jgi:hypothetical protein
MKLRAVSSFAGLFASLALAGASAHAATISGLVGTGAGLSAGQSDSNWTVTGASVSTGPAVVISPANMYGPWAADNASSSWVGACDCYDTPAFPYSFTESFNLTGYKLSSVHISGTWFIDDDGTLSVNGHLIDTESDTFSGAGFTVPTADLVSGLNNITITMTSDDRVLDGVRLQYSSDTGGSRSGVPEPATWALMLVGVGMTGAALRMQRRRGMETVAD